MEGLALDGKALAEALGHRRSAFGESEAPPSGQWVDASGEPVGEPFPIAEPEAAPVEAFLSDGAIGVDYTYPAVPLPDAPDGSARLSVRAAGDELMLVESDALALRAAALPAVPPRIFGRAQARFRFPIFSERFTDRARFEGFVQSLWDWIPTIPPFHEPAVRDNFALAAFFWPAADPVRGHFGTPDIDYDCVRDRGTTKIFLGNNNRARDALRRFMLQERFGLVLIDSRIRGGAGGMADHRFPAWSSVTDCPGEDWRAIALHEIAHGLGLADEYLLPARAGEAPKDEPNVSKKADPDKAPWTTNRPKASFGSPTATLAAQTQMQAGTRPIDRDAVGTFQGARYREDLYRPSYECLMRFTTTLRFCPICRQAIRKKLAG